MRKPRAKDRTPADQRVTLYMTVAEKQQAKELAANLSLNEYFRRCGLKKRPLAPAPQVNREIYLQLSRIGNNLNQMARACNRVVKQGGNININVECLKELEQQVRQLQLQVLNPDLVDLTTMERSE